MPPIVHVSPDKASLADALALWVAELSAKAIAERGQFAVAFSGGSLATILGGALCAEPHRSSVDWSKWHVFYADERCVPLDHEDSNHRLVSANFISKVPILAEHVHTIDPTLPAAGAAAAYEAQLVEVLGDSPALDLLLLGMGPDGHTCSLFPGHALLAEDRAWIASLTDSPKPPPSRITVTYRTIRNARAAAFVAAGAGKADTLKMVLEPANGADPLPAQLVQTAEGTQAHWWIDAPAAAGLSNL